MKKTKYLDIIKSPVITEKSTDARDYNTYSFYVDPKATKDEIKEAIELIFEVKVENVRTIQVPVKTKRVGRYTGKTNRLKKALVKLKDGETLEEAGE